MVSGVSFYPLILPFSWLDFSLYRRRGDTTEMLREKEWILGFAFQKFSLEMTPMAGEKNERNREGEVGGKGSSRLALGDHTDVRGVRSSLYFHRNCLLQMPHADGPGSMSPLWLGWCPMRSLHGQQQEHCLLTSQQGGCPSTSLGTAPFDTQVPQYKVELGPIRGSVV